MEGREESTREQIVSPYLSCLWTSFNQSVEEASVAQEIVRQNRPYALETAILEVSFARQQTLTFSGSVPARKRPEVLQNLVHILVHT